MDTRKIVDFALDDDAKEMRESLYASIYDRVQSAIEAKKHEVATNFFGGMPISTESVEQEGDVLDEEKEDEGHEDEAEDKEQCEKIAKKEVKGHEKRMHKED